MTVSLIIALVLSVLAVFMAIKACFVVGEQETQYLKMFDLMHESIVNAELELSENLKAITDIRQRLDDYDKMFGDTDNLSNTIQLSANAAVSDAMDQIDKSLDDNVRAINTIWQSVGTLKKRLDKLSPVERKPIDPAENLEHQTKLMDKMLKESTDIYSKKLQESLKKGLNDSITETIQFTNTATEDSTIYADKLKQHIVNPYGAMGITVGTNTTGNPYQLEEAVYNGISQRDDISKKYYDKLDAWKQKEDAEKVNFPVDPDFGVPGIDVIDDTEDTFNFDLSDFFTRREESPTEVLNTTDICSEGDSE